ncbi:uncharacterized protein LOC124174053 [Ischnura elegans]|uniref:uncharacterized protein LOC124174053 n=1 Tax=Ischnura elegans TaxID=197161 RepID=UPI001ED8AF25|nr:uncharacterized protein LOC124174053 [Ischnura elegans]
MKITRCGVISFFLSVIILACSGQKFSLGNCPTTLQSIATPSLTLANLLGVWREYARNKSPSQHSWRCATYTITLITTDSRYAVTVGGRKKITSTPLRVAGTIDVGGSTGTAATVTTFLTFTLTDGVYNKALKYYIVGLDNANPTYLALYACSNLGIGKLESAILLVRAGVTDANVRAGVQALAQNGFPATSLYFNFQTDCIL